METKTKETITVQVSVKAPVQKVWKCWNDPGDITKWCFASDDWHAPKASNDLRVNGKLCTRMESKDGSVGFDFEGVYTRVVENEEIRYVMSDGRQVMIKFENLGNETKVAETFDAENTHPLEVQRGGWQTILDNFKKHTERSL